MEKDLTVVHRSSYFSVGGCMTMMSPSSSCFPVHEEFQCSRIPCCNDKNLHNNKKGGKWRNLLKRFMREGKTVCGSKPFSFQYDPVSYSQNFDDGCHLREPRRLSLPFHDVSAAPLDRLESTAKHE